MSYNNYPNKQNSSSSSGGVGILGLLGLIFITLKLTNYIDWSWWWVTMPFWGLFALFFAVLFMAVSLDAIEDILKRKE